MNYDLVDLKLVFAIAEYGSLTRAAAKICLAPSSASSRLTKLESVLQARLFIRAARGLVPTAAGATVVRHARLVLARLQQLDTDLLPNVLSPKGQVTMLANAWAINAFLPDKLASFKNDYPDVRVCLEELPSPEIARAIAAGQADIGFAVMDSFPESLATYPFQNGRLALLLPVGHMLSDAKSIAFDEVLAEVFICLNAGSATHALLMNLGARHGLKLDVRFQVRSFDAVCRMVAAGLGIGVVPQAVLPSRMSKLYQNLLVVPLLEPAGEQTLHLCFQPGRHMSAAVTAMLKHLGVHDHYPVIGR